MSESMTVEQKMARSVETWRKCDPILMASQSQAALTFAFRDMKRDILVLADEVERLRHSVKFISNVNEAYNDAIDTLTKERDELRRRVADLEPKHECACGMCKMHKDVARIKAEAVREFGQWSDNQARSDWYGRTASDMAQTYANQIEGGHEPLRTELCQHLRPRVAPPRADAGEQRLEAPGAGMQPEPRRSASMPMVSRNQP